LRGVWERHKRRPNNPTNAPPNTPTDNPAKTLETHPQNLTKYVHE
jgi:hypothetical protein